MHRVLLLAAVLFPLVTEAAAQTVELREGSRVRVREAAGSPVETYTVVRVRPDAVVVRNESVGERRIALAEQAEVLVYTGQRPASARAGKGALGGLAVGAPLGIAMGFIDGDDPPGIVSFSAGEKALLAGVLLGGTGLVVGAMVGLASPGERWERLELEMRPTRAGYGERVLAIGYEVPF